MAETTQINPVVSQAHCCAKVAAYLDEARQQNAELISGNAKSATVLYCADAGD